MCFWWLEMAEWDQFTKEPLHIREDAEVKDVGEKGA